MIFSRLAVACLGFFLCTATANAADYYVAPSGSDSGSGTQQAPFATIERAYSAASAGSTIYVRGGLYNLKNRLLLNKSGSNGNLIKIFAYGTEVPILDGTNVSGTWNDGSLIRISGNYNHVRGLELRYGPYYGIVIDGSGSNNILERLNVHHSGAKSTSEGKGVFITGSASNNLVLNCDSHHNRDLNLGNADGFQVGGGSGNILRGNRAWRNSDDGFDLYFAQYPYLIEDNWAFENGYDDNLNRLGDGNGFKLGGQSGSGGHTLKNNVSWRNPCNGFDYNTGSKAFKLYNNTAYMNGPVMPGGENWGRDFQFNGASDVFRNNLSYRGGINVLNGDQKYNSWSLPVSVSDSDFLALDDSSARGPRQSDGSLPMTNFLHLVASSDLVDKGVSVGSSYSGPQPDLGAFEYSSSPAPAPAPTPSATVNIAYHGDSTIEGYTNSSTIVTKPAPQVMDENLPSNHSVRNEGVAGSTAGMILNGTDGKHPAWKTWVAQSQDQYIILNHALNDINAYGTDAYMSNLRQLIDIARSANKYVILETPNPTKSGAVVKTYADAMKSVAAEKNVPVIDQYTYLSQYMADRGLTAYDMTGDGVHPTQATYTLKGQYAAQRFMEITGLVATPTAPTPAPAPSPSPSVNLVLNPSFEKSANGWTLDWGRTAPTTEVASDGAYSLIVGYAAGGRGQNLSGVFADGTYVLTVDMRKSTYASAWCGVSVEFKDSSGRIISGISSSVTAQIGGWKTLQTTFNAPKSFSSARIAIWKEADRGYCYVDNVRLQKK